MMELMKITIRRLKAMATVTKRSLLIPLFGGMLLWFSCQEEAAPIPEEIENEPATGLVPSSELALFMRDLYADFEQASETYKKGEFPSFDAEYNIEDIYTAHPTDTTIKGPGYDAMSYSFLHQVKSYFTLSDPEASDKELFNNMITACIDCHQVYCPGPIKKIQKLHLPDSILNTP